MFTTALNLPVSDRSQLVDLLNQQLANLSDLSSQTKQAHWNVRGRHFYHQHKLFEDLYHVVDAHLDELAERIATLGGYARGTVRDAAAASRLDPFPGEQGDDFGYIDVLSARFATTANEVRIAIDTADEIGDATSTDLLTEISRGLDKSLWFLEAHLRSARGPLDTEASGDSTTTTAKMSRRSGQQPQPRGSARARGTRRRREQRT
jgi:starvation-inducible DNA-binding protein